MVRLSNMKATLSPSDIFEIRKTSLISSNDYEYALDLYAPIIGVKNLAVYFAFISEKGGEQKPVSGFLTKNQLSCGEMSGALSYLEAVGLVKSYQKNLGKSHLYLYSILSPRTPAQFFKNELLHGALRSYLGAEGCKRIVEKYEADPIEEGFEEISERFVDVLHIDLSKASLIETPNASERVSGRLQLGFDRNVFMSSLLQINPFIKPAFITKDELERISGIAALYNYEESAIASFVAESYDPKKVIGKRINFDRLNDFAEKNLKYDYMQKEDVKSSRSIIHGDAPTASLIRSMDNMTTIEFLTRLQRGHKPAPSDLMLVDTLINEMGVPQNVVNALIFHVLMVQDNVLTNAYVTRLGAQLVRAGITNALDALNYLGSRFKKNTTKKTSVQKPADKPQQIAQPAKKEEVVTEVEEDVDEEEFEELLKNRDRK